MENTGVTKHGLNQTAVNLGFLLLLLFLFLRPIAFAFEDFEGIPVQKIFPVFFSYLFLIVILFYIVSKHIKFDLISTVILTYCAYCFLSILWGSQIGWLVRWILPFTLFFAVRFFVKDARDVNILLITLLVGYIFPIVASTILILKGGSLEVVEWYSGLKRYQGVFSGEHPMAHAMTFFSFLIGFIFVHVKVKTKLFKFGLFFLLILSIFCLYKTVVRNALLGCIIFWFLLLVMTNKKYAFVFVIAVLLVFIIKSGKVENIFWKGKAHHLEHTLNAASSGRLEIWEHNLSIYSDLSIEKKILGLGIGVEGNLFSTDEDQVWPSHNDYLSLLMTVGILGLIYYLSIFMVILRDIYYSGVEKRIKHLIIAILVPVIIMNFLSNAYITRVEMGELLWFLLGIFYSLDGMQNKGESDL